MPLVKLSNGKKIKVELNPDFDRWFLLESKLPTSGDSYYATLTTWKMLKGLS